MAVGKKFSVDFQQAVEINGNTQIMVQPEGQPVEKASVEQLGAALINDGVVPSPDGSYHKMTVGFAENIVGDGSATAEEFSFRPTAGVNRNTLNDGAARIHSIKGRSVVANQLLSHRTETFERDGIIMTQDGSGWITVKGTATSDFIRHLGNAQIIKGNHYYLYGVPKNGSLETYYLSDQAFMQDLGDGIINVPNYSDNRVFVLTVMSGTTVDFKFFPKVINLTQEFGAGNEPTTVAEYFQRKPILLNEDEYNEGKLVNLVPQTIKTTGFNQWDEQWERGAFDYYTGAKITDNSRIRSKNFIPVFPGTQYYYKMPNNWQVCYWDAEKQFISASQNSTDVAENTPQNCHYITFNVGYSGAPITEYNNDICISLYWPTEYSDLYGTYQPYKPFERDLSWVAKYFPNGMRSAGNVADEIRFNSTTQQWEAVQRVDVRPYAAGDESDSAVTTDGTNTNYTLATPTITPIVENINFDYDVSDYGTEELIVAEGVESAPLSASIEYSPNVLAMLKNAPGIANDVDMLKSQLSAITAQLATLTLNNN